MGGVVCGAVDGVVGGVAGGVDGIATGLSSEDEQATMAHAINAVVASTPLRRVTLRKEPARPITLASLPPGPPGSSDAG